MCVCVVYSECVCTWKTLYEVLLQFQGSVHSFSGLFFCQTSVDLSVKTTQRYLFNTPNTLYSVPPVLSKYSEGVLTGHSPVTWVAQRWRWDEAEPPVVCARRWPKHPGCSVSPAAPAPRQGQGQGQGSGVRVRRKDRDIVFQGNRCDWC